MNFNHYAKHNILTLTWSCNKKIWSVVLELHVAEWTHVFSLQVLSRETDLCYLTCFSGILDKNGRYMLV